MNLQFITVMRLDQESNHADGFDIDEKQPIEFEASVFSNDQEGKPDVTLEIKWRQHKREGETRADESFIMVNLTETDCLGLIKLLKFSIEEFNRRDHV